MTREQWDELFLKVDTMPLDELEKIIVDSARKAGILQTNADRIRGMSDEELAEWMKLMVCKYRSCGNCPMSDWCTPGRGIAEWLEAPADKEGE